MLPPTVILSRLSFAVACLLLASGCALKPAPREALFVKAGFRNEKANSPAKVKLYDALPPGRITPVLHTRRTYFVFPEPKREAVWVGGPTEFKIYENARANRGMESDAPTLRALENPVDWNAWRGLNHGWYTLSLPADIPVRRNEVIVTTVDKAVVPAQRR